MRTSEDKHSFIKNLLFKTSTIESSLDMTHHKKMKIIEEADVTHHSVNPRQHCYSRGVDFIRPKKLRMTQQ